MGLDMYLLKKHYVGNSYRKPRQMVKVIIPKNQKDASLPIKKIENKRIVEITEQVARWRKANAIHKWFVDNAQNGVDDCKEYYVSEEQLKDLRDLCEQVIKASKLVKGKVKNGYKYENGKLVPILEGGEYIKNPSVARKLLPTQEGFFFGSYDYDQWYMEDIKYTAKTLKKLLAKNDNGGFYYSSSW